MPILNFKKRFAALIESGEKCQSIRAFRKDGRNPKIRDRLYLYTGLRTKECRKIKEAICVRVCHIRICEGFIVLDGKRLTKHETEALAKKDGFRSYSEMSGWFKNTHKRLPFNGLLIQWEAAMPQSTSFARGKNGNQLN